MFLDARTASDWSFNIVDLSFSMWRHLFLAAREIFQRGHPKSIFSISALARRRSPPFFFYDLGNVPLSFKGSEPVESREQRFEEFRAS